MLKLGQPRNAYDSLGLPRSATSVQLRARFRQLVRAYRKELTTKDLFQDERFRHWTNAYLLLTSPQRRDYDRRLRQTRGRERPGDLLSALPQPQMLLIEAEAALVRRKLHEAVELAKEAVKQDQRNAEGYALLGDIMREQSNYANALTMYNYAIQFDPNNPRYWQLLQEVTTLQQGRALPRRFRLAGRSTVLNRPGSAWAGVALTMLLVALSLVYVSMHLGQPSLFQIPVNLIYGALAQGFVLGLVLAGTAVIGPFDDELIWYQIAGFGVETTPLGIFVAVPGVIFFWSVPVFYAICAYLDEHLSLSVVIALFLCSLLTVALGALSPPESRKAVYLLAGNFVWFGFLWGWLFGSIRLRVFEH